jgi:hypothetical protein
MSDFRHKLRKEVVDPALKTSRKATLIAVITDKKSNSYTIQFTDENGEKQKQSGISARRYGNETPQGYEINETVLVEYDDTDKKYEIISSYGRDYAEVKATTELKTDIFSNLISSTIPGYQF